MYVHISRELLQWYNGIRNRGPIWLIAGPKHVDMLQVLHSRITRSNRTCRKLEYREGELRKAPTNVRPMITPPAPTLGNSLFDKDLSKRRLMLSYSTLFVYEGKHREYQLALDYTRTPRFPRYYRLGTFRKYCYFSWCRACSKYSIYYLIYIFPNTQTAPPRRISFQWRHRITCTWSL